MINKRLITMMGDSIKWIYKNIFYKWIALLCNVGIIFLIGFFLEKLFIERKFLFMGVFLLVALIIIRFFCIKKALDCSFYASVNVKETLRDKLYRKLLSLYPSYQSHISTSEIVQVSVEGVEQLEIYFSKYLPQFFYSLLAPLTLFVILAFFDFKAAFALLLCVPLIPMSIMFIMKFAKKIVAKYWGEYTSLGDHFLDHLQGLTTLKIYDRDEDYHEKMNQGSERFRKITMKVLTMQLNSVTIMDLLAYGSTAIGAIIAISDLTSGKINFMVAFAIIMLASEFFIPLRLLGSFFHIAMNGMAASDKIFKILDQEEENQAKNEEKFPEKTDIIISKLNFVYDTQSFALKNINMTVPAGSLVSIVGKSGCGKSTMATLIQGLNNNYDGEINFSTTNIKNLSREECNKHIVTIGSNSYIFKGTIRYNLLWSKPDATEKEMIAVLNKTNLYEELSGLDYEVAERGSNLSGGQRQRLSIARALLADAKIYIFDEATSGIDAESEEIIMKNIQELKREKSVILISHRLYNVKNSDEIFVLEEGQLIEQGTHEQLLKNKSVYENLYNEQKEFEEMRFGKCLKEK